MEKEGLSKDLNVVLVPPGYIRELNRRYRQRDFATDVLSFDLDDVAEIYIRKDDDMTLDSIWELTLHGLLHLLGYDHEDEESWRKMEAIARRYRS